MTNKILVPVDLGEPESVTKVLPIAESLAKADSAELHVVYVVPSYSMPIVGSYFPKGQEAAMLEDAKAALKQAIADHAADPAVTKGHIAHGTIYDEVLRVAKELDVSLIVMMAHKPGFRDYLLGPNAARVARHATQSVYLVRD